MLVETTPFHKFMDNIPAGFISLDEICLNYQN